MPYDYVNQNWSLTPLLEKLVAEKKAGLKLQERKHQDWTDNYELYRNKVKTNRLTQRQAVNIPLMKETIKTQLSVIDDPPIVDWKELSGDEEKELIFQEVWNQMVKDNNMDLVDVLDKKNVLLYGFSVRKLNISKEGISISVLDPYDTFIDPLTNPWNIETARFITHQNIFKSVRDILADPKYSKEGKEDLKIWAESPQGMLQSQKTREQWENKMERLRSMGVEHGDFSLYAGGDMLVNLTEHFTHIWNTGEKKFERKVFVYADDKIELADKTLKEAVGVDFWPIVYWAEDPEVNEVYPDSIADLVRTPNKVLNVWFSQMLENRTLKNFQMHWFLPMEGYQPQTYTPGQGMMLPAPPGDDINKVIKPVDISGLDDTMAAIQAVTQIVERGTGATAIQKGQAEQGQQTLGEVQILVGNARERSVAMTKFYRIAMYELAMKWNRMLHANAPKFMKLYKQGQSGKMYPKRVYAGDWVSKAGYEAIVKSSSEQETDGLKTIQKFQFILSQFPNNTALKTIAQKRMLETVDLTPEELREVEQSEKDSVQRQMMEPTGPTGPAPGQSMSPSPQPLIQ